MTRNQADLTRFGVTVRDARPGQMFSRTLFVWATNQHDATMRALAKLRDGTIGWVTAVEVFLVTDEDLTDMFPDLKRLAQRYWMLGRANDLSDDAGDLFEEAWREAGPNVEVEESC